MFRMRWRRALTYSAGGLLFAALLYCAFLFAGLPDPEASAARAETPSILINDRHGRLLYEVIDPRGNKHVPLPLAEIPLACRQATIATEDSRFYSHPGIDPIAILRAVWQNWRTSTSDQQQPLTISGASTLTQQLARNLYLPENERVERSLRRKLREAWLAWRLERAYSKDELLALYLNTTYYGHFAAGIEAAAQAYFGVHAQELDLAQCALLAGLPQNPINYSPIENPEAARRRQGVVLDLMAKHGYLTSSRADEARGEALAYAGTPFPIEAPHFVMWVQSQLEQSLGLQAARSGGLRVTTTLDLDWQRRAEEIVRRRLAQLRPCAGNVIGAAPGVTCDAEADPARRVENAALVALDPESGAVLAMVGSPDYFDPRISGAVNATLSQRQPGSAIKPITYAAAMDPARAEAAGRQPWTPATLIADLRTVFATAEGKPYVPQNYDRRFHGPVAVRTALANSYNVPAVKTLQYIGVDALIDQASRMGIPWNTEPRSRNVEAKTDGLVLAADMELPAASSQNPAPHFGLALTLGGGEVRLLDLTAAYGAFANGGFRVTPYAISRVETLAGDVLFSQPNNLQPVNLHPVLDPRVAYLITDILSDEVARLPAFGPGNVLEIGRPAAGKTGTTTDWRDNWTIGYTPELVTGVWVGNADNTPMRDVSGISGAGPIWHDFMVSVLRDASRPPREFPRPNGLVRVEICADSGLLPGDVGPEVLQSEPQNPGFAITPCPHRRFEWFITGTEPMEVDTSHRAIALDLHTGRPATAVTPSEYVQWQTFWVLPPEFQAWARDNGIPQPPAVVSNGLATEASTSDSNRSSGTTEAIITGLRLTSPEPNRIYRLDPELPADAQQIPVTAVPGPSLLAGDARVELLLDGASLATVGGPDYTAWWPLTSGLHTFQAVATGTNGQRIESRLVTVLVE